MMAQNDLGVAGIDVAKDKVDVCIRALSLRRTFASTVEGRRELVSWLRRQKVGKAVMEASGGYERDWAKALRNAKIEVRIVDPKRVRSFAQSAGRLAKNDTIDAEMIAWFAETFDEARGQTYDATREQLHQMVNARQALKDMQAKLENQGEHTLPAAVQRMHARILKTISVELVKLEAAISAMIQATAHFAELAEIIESIPGLGRNTSAGLIAAMPELGQANNKIVAKPGNENAVFELLENWAAAACKSGVGGDASAIRLALAGKADLSESPSYAARKEGSRLYRRCKRAASAVHRDPGS
jgi:transposase